MKLTQIDLGATSEFAISFLSDLHVDSPRCNLGLLRSKLARITEAYPNHHAILIGDIGDFILPFDMRRFSPSASRKNLATRDDFIIARAELIAEELKKLPVTIDLIGRGNHEDEVLKRYGIDPISIICSKLGCSAGWYEGCVIYRVSISSKPCSITIVYHHGAWGGRLAKGYIGALDYFSQIEGWDIAVYGHNHMSRSDQERRISIDSRTHTVREKDVYIINCSSWVNGRDGQALTDVTPYDVRRGLKRQPNTLNSVVVRPYVIEGHRGFRIELLTT